MLNLFNIHVLMKKILLFMLCILSFALQAQQTWQVELPYTTSCPECDTKKLIKTIDGGYLILLRKVVDPPSTPFFQQFFKF